MIGTPWIEGHVFAALTFASRCPLVQYAFDIGKRRSFDLFKVQRVFFGQVSVLGYLAALPLGCAASDPPPAESIAEIWCGVADIRRHLSGWLIFFCRAIFEFGAYLNVMFVSGRRRLGGQPDGMK